MTSWHLLWTRLEQICCNCVYQATHTHTHTHTHQTFDSISCAMDGRCLVQQHPTKTTISSQRIIHVGLSESIFIHYFIDFWFFVRFSIRQSTRSSKMARYAQHFGPEQSYWPLNSRIDQQWPPKRNSGDARFGKSQKQTQGNCFSAFPVNSEHTKSCKIACSRRSVERQLAVQLSSFLLPDVWRSVNALLIISLQKNILLFSCRLLSARVSGSRSRMHVFSFSFVIPVNEKFEMRNYYFFSFVLFVFFVWLDWSLR